MIGILFHDKEYADIKDLFEDFEKGCADPSEGMSNGLRATLIASCVEWKGRGCTDRDKLIALSDAYVRGHDIKTVVKESLFEMVDYMKKSHVRRFAFADLFFEMDEGESRLIGCYKNVDYGWE